MRHILSVLPAGFFLMAVLAIPATAQKWGKISDEEWDISPPSGYPDANAVIIFDKGVMEVTVEGISFLRHVRMKVFNQAGAEEAADVTFHCHQEDKIRAFKAHTITPDGKTHKVKKKYKKSVGSRQLRTFSFPSVESGSILEYTYGYLNERFSYLDPWRFQGDLYTLKSSYELKLAPGFTYSAVSHSLPGEARQPETEEDPLTHVRSHVWTMENLPPLKEEPYMSSIKNFTPSLYNQLVSYKDPYTSVTFIEGWPDLGDKYTKSLEEYVGNPQKLQPILEEIIGDITDNVARSRAVYDHVCRNIRTREDEEGYRWTHENLHQVVEQGFATAEEKNILLVELSKLAGLSAWPVLIATREHAAFNPDIYQISQFDHLIALVETDSGAVYLDAASRYCPYGTLPPQCSVTGGFLLDGKESQLVKIVTRQPRTYRLDATHVEIAGDGTITCSTSVQLSGHFTSVYGSRYEREKPEDFIETYFLGKLDCPYEILDHSFDYDDAEQRCRLTVNYSLSDYVESIDDNLLLPPVCFWFRENPFTAESRTYPVDFDYPFTYHNIVTITAQDSLAALKLPRDSVLQISGAGFHRQSRAYGDRIQVETILEVANPVFSPYQYRQLRRFFADMVDLGSEPIALSLH
ncbi:MAG: DUF3857 domain-containing protein [Candidatus Zixiibacteriota bacterium]